MKEALKQIGNLANLPFAFHHVAIMPDCHGGYGMPIGGVLATNKVIIPNAVGVDIGCGMCTVKTPWKVEEINTDTIKKIMGKIREKIPVGFEHHKAEQSADLMPAFPSSSIPVSFPRGDYKIILQQYQSALTQLGTLGGGNHFIEIQKDQENNVWIMIHSGSRNLGFKVAHYYNELAKALNGKWYAYVPKEWDLAFLPLDSDEGHAYMREMQYCVDFAFANRKLMMERIAEAFDEVINWKKIDLSGMINIAHNYAKMENHFGQNVMVHRKGATLATKDLIGIIPGSQGTSSYIVSGLGNPESFMSCSHGAGRALSRSKAKATLNLADEQKRLDDKGIVHGLRSVSELDEAAGAYKDIDIVMQEQKDLVEIKVRLEPMGVIKGD
jgi:tRNA-splicing ligase RtcB